MTKKHLKPLILVLIGAIIGGVIGQSRVLCEDGQCVMTSSWYGGALFGAAIGWVLNTILFGCPCSGSESCTAFPSDEEEAGCDTEQQQGETDDTKESSDG